MVTVEWSGDQPMTNGLHIRCMVIDTIDTTETVQWELTATFSIQPTTLTKDTLLVISYSNRAPYSEQEQHYHTHRLHKLFDLIKQQLFNIHYCMPDHQTISHCSGTGIVTPVWRKWYHLSRPLQAPGNWLQYWSWNRAATCSVAATPFHRQYPLLSWRQYSACGNPTPEVVRYSQHSANSHFRFQVRRRARPRSQKQTMDQRCVHYGNSEETLERGSSPHTRTNH